ncbi:MULTISPECIES: class I adenylate-forming enzyme family protein [unclassified Phenylobacterium]|uniref:class I adenylate-forming enzyme family protein n=1 Tax=unclassified Phenylobacterium TaxID=2640670 RepID=UPI00083A5314|nr:MULTISPECIES: class I adenylate-forming enzyme family protein [unclassified Phenylobacterium]
MLLESPADREAVRLYRGAGFDPAAHPAATIPALLERQAARLGDRPYLTAVPPRGEPETLSFAETAGRARAVALWAQASLDGARSGVVALAPRNDLASVVTIFGLLHAGLKILLLNPADPPDRKRQQIEAAGAEAAVSCSPRHEDPKGWLALPEVPLPGDERVPLPSPQDDGSFLIGTSGSTAASKLVLQTHANALANAAAVVRHHALAPGDRFAGCLPIHHVNGLHFTLVGMLAAGAHAILFERFDPFGYPRALQAWRPRIASVVPSLLEALLAGNRGEGLPDSLHYFVSAAAPLATATARQVADSLRRRVVQGYGLTETTNFSCTLPADLSETAYARLMLDADIPSIGVAVPGNEVAVLDPDGRVLPPGERGEICMRGHNVMAGYAGNPEATAEAFRGGWFHSQDLGMVVRDGESDRAYFVITGRAKNMAKVAGEAVSLEEAERVLRKLPGVADAACAAMSDPLYGERLVALLVLTEELPDAAVRAHLAAAMSAAAQPARILRVPGIPRTQTGKIRRPELKQLVAELTGRKPA